ncbi:MAG: TetR/AcrR family transcriptional regulator [Victivallales bacterium]|jgi:AcrR family transcriptional regulator|nr:TetR/AcrR family transcriptional regulator [Victivallales bacterium]MBT7302209.1 TetR/AcrR family transcriptional regulator [Victivallales bacterium]
MSRREQILESSLGLFRRYGVRKTTVADIAEAAGIGKGSVYLEFAGKEDVFFALIEEHERGILAEVQAVAAGGGPVGCRLTEAALVRPRRNLQEMGQLPEAFEMLASLRGPFAERVRPYQEQCIEVVSGLIAEGCREGEFGIADTASCAATFYEAFDVGFVYAMHGVTAADMESRLRRLAEMLVSGLRGGEALT